MPFQIKNLNKTNAIMNRFNLIFSAGLALVISGLAVSCTTGSGGQDNVDSLSISLSSDKNSIFADGSDAATFTVVNNSSREDITDQAQIFCVSGDQETELTAPKFSTETPGSYSFYAKYNEAISKEISVTAARVDADASSQYTLSAAKNMIYNDGGDFAILTLTDAEGNDVTELGQFYADGEPVEGNRFSTTKGSFSPVVISATVAGSPVKNTVEVTATSSYGFTSRALLEEITRTNCEYCPIMIRVISELASDNPETVIAYNVHNTVSSVYESWYSEKSQEWSRLFCDFINVGANAGDKKYTGAPRSFLNRSKDDYTASENLAQTFRNAAINGAKDVAIAMWSSTPDANTIKLNATVGTKKDFNGKIVAVLTDNGIEAAQNGEMINMFRVMKAYYPGVEGQAAAFAKGKPQHFEAEFNLQETPVTSIENCELIVFVTDDADGLCENVQVAHVGEAKGY